jgi:hypothetical protein
LLTRAYSESMTYCHDLNLSIVHSPYSSNNRKKRVKMWQENMGNNQFLVGCMNFRLIIFAGSFKFRCKKSAFLTYSSKTLLVSLGSDFAETIFSL